MREHMKLRFRLIRRNIRGANPIALIRSPENEPVSGRKTRTRPRSLSKLISNYGFKAAPNPVAPRKNGSPCFAIETAGDGDMIGVVVVNKSVLDSGMKARLEEAEH